MTYGEIILLSFVGTIIMLFAFVVVDRWLTHRRLVRERKSREMFRKLHDQLIADAFRPKR